MTSHELLGIPMAAGGRVDIYSGVARLAGKVWASCHRPDGGSRTAVMIVHPSSNFLGHYALSRLADRGVTAVGMNTRYLGNDSALLVENRVLDVGAGVRYLREEEGFDHVVLLGNSGGGGLISLYQSQAEQPSITGTPAGDPPDLTQADLLPADGVICAMAHTGRALVYTEWLDPAITDEQAPFEREASLDMFDPANGPPFSEAFMTRYRDAQVERNRRITRWVRDQLAALPAGVNDLPFVVHGTVADPRMVDLTIEPSDRQAGTLWGEALVANYNPATLGHMTSLRSWLSQWSIDDSNADGPLHLGRVSVPVLVVYGTADGAALPSHAHALHDGVGHHDRELVAIEGAGHYFEGRPDLIDTFCDIVVDWLRDHDLL